MEEVYVNIEGTNGKYQISNYGNVISYKRVTPVQLKHSENNYGYKHVNIAYPGITKTEPIHKLVAQHFLPRSLQHDLEIDHIDNDPSNNRVDNLQYLTKADNLRKSHKTTQHNYSDGVRNKLTALDKKCIVEDLYAGVSLGALSKQYDVSRTTIFKIKKKFLPTPSNIKV